MGVAERSRKRAMSSTPSRSGKPRSTMTSAGCWSFASRSPSVAVDALTGRSPLALRLAATNWAMEESSSTIRTVALAMRITRLCHWQVDSELGTRRAPAGLYPSSVSLHDGLADREAEPGAAGAHRDENPVAAAPGLDHDLRLRAGVAQGVVDEIRDDLGDEARFGADRGHTARDPPLDVRALPAAAHAFHRAAQQFLDRLP